jgi:hypothetical protein
MEGISPTSSVSIAAKLELTTGAQGMDSGIELITEMSFNNWEDTESQGVVITQGAD